MVSKSELETIIQRQTAVIKEQLARIAELESEVSRLNTAIATNHDALAVLQRVYSDPASPVSVTLKAASEANQAFSSSSISGDRFFSVTAPNTSAALVFTGGGAPGTNPIILPSPCVWTLTQLH